MMNNPGITNRIFLEVYRKKVYPMRRCETGKMVLVPTTGRRIASILNPALLCTSVGFCLFYYRWLTPASMSNNKETKVALNSCVKRA